MHNDEIIPHLFRNEYRKIVAVLCKRFGFSAAEAAEDITGETFLTAAQTWGLKGIPENPVAWLHHVAANKAINYLRREAIYNRNVDPEAIHETADDFVESRQSDEIDLSDSNIFDSQLKMMFAICHPALSDESQIALALRLLCGFGIEEIADALLTSTDAISKRLYRAKKMLRKEKVQIEFPELSDIPGRLETVLRIIYLLFSEGYYSCTGPAPLRKDLCLEAMRLCSMLLDHESTGIPSANALMALMCFHASRFDARSADSAVPSSILYDDQNSELWNVELIQRGMFYLNESTGGAVLTRYHLEATIASLHTSKSDSKGKWETILELYDILLKLDVSPAVILNRACAIAHVHGPEMAIIEAEKCGLTHNHLYHMLMGELYSNLDQHKATEHYNQALLFAKSDFDKEAIHARIKIHTASPIIRHTD